MKTITVNGKNHPFKAECTLTSILDELGITPKHMAIEHNGEIIPRNLLHETRVNPGDIIEIIQFVGGG